MKLLSESKAGRWSTMLTVVFVLLMVLKFSARSTGIILPLPAVILAVLPIAGFFLGVISVVKHRDRSILILISILLGFLVLLWVGAELAFPH